MTLAFTLVVQMHLHLFMKARYPPPVCLVQNHRTRLPCRMLVVPLPRTTVLPCPRCTSARRPTRVALTYPQVLLAAFLPNLLLRTTGIRPSGRTTEQTMNSRNGITTSILLFHPSKNNLATVRAFPLTFPYSK